MYFVFKDEIDTIDLLSGKVRLYNKGTVLWIYCTTLKTIIRSFDDEQPVAQIVPTPNDMSVVGYPVKVIDRYVNGVWFRTFEELGLDRWGRPIYKGKSDSWYADYVTHHKPPELTEFVTPTPTYFEKVCRFFGKVKNIFLKE